MNAALIDIAANLIEWLAGDFCHNQDIAGLLEGLGVRLRNAGIALDRLALHLLVIDPEILGRTLAWSPGEMVETVSRLHGFEYNAGSLKSPIRHVLETGNWYSLRADAADTASWFTHEVYHGRSLAERLYVPLKSGETWIGAICFASRDHNGFSAEDRALFHRILPALRSSIELKALQERGANLLDTYIGSETGRRILAGHVQRGNVETIEAALMLCDMRDFTGLSNRLPSERVLSLLNDYFDQVLPAIARHGGEVLKFIGDAVLASFRIGDDPARNSQAAFAAAHDALAELARMRTPDIALKAGVALHYGKASYGNIGSGHRLDFTVIGPDVNLTSRIQSVCGSTGRPLLMSRRFAELLPQIETTSVGSHDLKGFAEKIELFAPKDAWLPAGT
ncbi:MAG TPA: adenylate/guanylate cyclase domain-containing protein [Dongiaceae bacterium]|nr:adenylate/guanylate cyclase domain-containing protein [Dongiaceae bacterium]